MKSLMSFFFSSRRRNTRYIREWSSDVCSSDLGIAKGLIEWSGDANLRETFKQYDWAMVKSDVRFKEPKKPGGRGARSKFQKSYR